MERLEIIERNGTSGVSLWHVTMELANSWLLIGYCILDTVNLAMKFSSYAIIGQKCNDGIFIFQFERPTDFGRAISKCDLSYYNGDF